MQNIAGYSVGQFTSAMREAQAVLANLRWRKVLADLGLLALALMTCSLLSRG
jgi:hypothetical protein